MTTSVFSKLRVKLALLLAGAAMSGVSLPAQAQTISSSCRLAEPNSNGQHVSEICWFQFGNAGEMLPSGTTRDYDFSLPDGSRITMGVAISGGSHTPASERGLQVRQAPTWTGSNFSGNSNYYKILTPNGAALNSAVNGGANGVVLTASDIRLFRPDGSEVTDVPFEMIFADAERLNSNPEHMDFGVVSGGTAFEIVEWLGTAPASAVSQSTPPASSACLSSYVDCLRFSGTTGNGNANAVVLATQRNINGSAPFTVMGQIHSSGGQGFAIGVRWGSVRLRKAVPEGRIATSDQFVYQLRNISEQVVAQNTTSGSTTASTPSPWISTTAMPGNVIRIEEAMASGSASALGQYSSWVRCEGGVGGGSTVIIDQAYNAANPPQINLGSAINEPGYNIDCEITNRPAQFDLRVQKVLSLVDGQSYTTGQAVTPGQVLTYAITVQNVGSTQAIVPVGAVTESLPQGTTLDGATTDFTCYLNSCSNASALTIAAGASTTLDFVVRVNSPFGQDPYEVRNAVAVSGVDCAASGNSCEVVVPVNKVADLSIDKQSNPSEVLAGGTVTYTMVVSNGGPDAADGALVADPAVADLDCVTPANLSCTSTGGAVCPASPLSITTLQGSGLIIPTFPSSATVTLTLICTAGTASNP